MYQHCCDVERKQQVWCLSKLPFKRNAMLLFKRSEAAQSKLNINQHRNPHEEYRETEEDIEKQREM